MARTDAIAEHPDFPWLDADDPESLEKFLQERCWLGEGETIQQLGKAGEGNMNLTLRIRTDQRVFIIKQARPWVEKYDTIDAPWDRAVVEQRFYERVATLPRVAAMMPRLIHGDAQARTLMLEFIEGAGDFADIYHHHDDPSGGLTEGDTDRLMGYLAALHAGTRGQSASAGPPDPETDVTLANRAMRRLNAEHVFHFPLDPDNGLDLDAIEPGLAQAAAALIQDEAYRAAVAQAHEWYLTDGPCLLHGDFFPGSWLRGHRGPVVIDPEFCFFGDPAFDLAIPVAHLLLAGRPLDEARQLIARYREAEGAQGVEIDEAALARFAAIEVMRRLIGVAQLPLNPPTGFRADLLSRSRPAAIQASLKTFRR